MAHLGQHGPLLDAIRQAFSSGRSAAGEELFASALDAGVPWDLATRAVAEGVTHHYRARPRDRSPDPDDGQRRGLSG
jgi:hypothetical protein